MTAPRKRSDARRNEEALLAAADEIIPDVDALWLMRGVGNICIGADGDPGYDARRMVRVVVSGLRAGLRA